MSDRAPPAMRPRLPPSGPVLQRRALLRGAAALAAAGALSPWPALAQQPRYVQIGTGTTGGTYFLIGSILANAISSPAGGLPCDRGGSCGVPGLIALAQSTSGAVENIQLMREGRLETGLVQADIAHAAFLGEGPFGKEPPFDTLRAIANLYPETIHLVARADGGIASVNDLRGKRVAMGEQGSGTLVTARALLAAYGLSEKAFDPVYLSPGAAGDRLVTGDLDAFFIVGGYPLPSVADLSRRLPIALVPFADERAAQLQKRLPLYMGTQIEENAYEGVPATRTLGIGAQWVVRGDVPDELVHGITAALWNETTSKLLVEGHPRGAAIRITEAVKALAVPLHPGAERYYREAGQLSMAPAEPPAEPAPAAPPTSPTAQPPGQ